MSFRVGSYDGGSVLLVGGGRMHHKFQFDKDEILVRGKVKSTSSRTSDHSFGDLLDLKMPETLNPEPLTSTLWAHWELSHLDLARRSLKFRNITRGFLLEGP